MDGGHDEDLLSGRVGCTGNERLPPHSRKPARAVAEDLLKAWRCEFRHPVVLSSRRRRHGGHLGERGRYWDSHKPSRDEYPDRTSSAAIDQGKGSSAVEECLTDFSSGSLFPIAATYENIASQVAMMTQVSPKIDTEWNERWAS